MWNSVQGCLWYILIWGHFTSHVLISNGNKQRCFCVYAECSYTHAVCNNACVCMCLYRWANVYSLSVWVQELSWHQAEFSHPHHQDRGGPHKMAPGSAPTAQLHGHTCPKHICIKYMSHNSLHHDPKQLSHSYSQPSNIKCVVLDHIRDLYHSI